MTKAEDFGQFLLKILPPQKIVLNESYSILLRVVFSLHADLFALYH